MRIFLFGLMTWLVFCVFIQAQEVTTPESDEILQRHGIHISKPVFLDDLNMQRDEGVYFGFGLQQFRLQPGQGKHTVNTDSASNGVAFNLGYFTQHWIAEYSQHILLTELKEHLVTKQEKYEFVNVIQHHFVTQMLRKLSQEIYLGIGGGLQFSELSLFRIDNRKEAISKDEYALLVDIGLTFFATKTVAIQIRAKRSMVIPLLQNPQTAIFQNSDVLTIFLQYYFNIN